MYTYMTAPLTMEDMGKMSLKENKTKRNTMQVVYTETW